MIKGTFRQGVQQDKARTHSGHFTTTWLHHKIVQVLDWPACSSGLPPFKASTLQVSPVPNANQRKGDLTKW